MTNTPPPSSMMMAQQTTARTIRTPQYLYLRFDIRLRTCVQLSNHLPIPGLRLNYVIHIAWKNGTSREVSSLLSWVGWWCAHSHCGRELSGLENLFLMVVRPQGRPGQAVPAVL